jgi:hypothetical protein
MGRPESRGAHPQAGMRARYKADAGGPHVRDKWQDAGSPCVRAGGAEGEAFGRYGCRNEEGRGKRMHATLGAGACVRGDVRPYHLRTERAQLGRASQFATSKPC